MAIHTTSCLAEHSPDWPLLSNVGYLFTLQEQGATLLLYQLQSRRGRKIKAQINGSSKLAMALSFPEAGWGQQLVASVAALCCPAPSSSQCPAHCPSTASRASSPRGALALWSGRSAPFLPLASSSFGSSQGTQPLVRGQQGGVVGLEEERLHWAPSG